LREFYKKYFYKENESGKSKRLFLIIIFNIFIVYFLLNTVYKNKNKSNIEIISSKLTTTSVKLPLEKRLQLLNMETYKVEYMIDLKVKNLSKSDSFLIDGQLITKDTTYYSKVKAYLESDSIRQFELIFPKIKNIKEKKDYKIDFQKLN
jgi:hypothetical protein